MPLIFKQEKQPNKSRKPLSSSTNTKDSLPRKQKSYSKKQKQKQFINKTIPESKNNAIQDHQKYYKKVPQIKTNKAPKLSQSNQSLQSPIKLQFLQNKREQSAKKKLDQSWHRLKQSVKEGNFNQKFSKKDIVNINISIIEEKSLLSNNQENSIDSLNNLIIQGNNDQTSQNKSLLEKSNEESSLESYQIDQSLIQKSMIGKHGNQSSLNEDSNQSNSFKSHQEEDWSDMQNQYLNFLHQNQQNTQLQFQYLKIVDLFNLNNGEQQINKDQLLNSQKTLPIQSINQQIKKLIEDIRRLKKQKQNKEKFMQLQEESLVINDLFAENKPHLQKQVIGFNNHSESNVKLSSESNENQDNTNSNAQQQKQHNNQLEGQVSLKAQTIFRHNERKKSINNLVRESQNQIGSRQEDQHEHLADEISNKKQLQKVISSQQKIKSTDQYQNGMLIKKSIQKLDQNRKISEHYQEQEQEQIIKDLINQQQKSIDIVYQQQQSILQDSKSQEEFIQYMDKEYDQKKQAQENHANFSLNNISNIMKIKPLEFQNKSISNQHEIKQKEDDQVVAMLNNQLRDKHQQIKNKNNKYIQNKPKSKRYKKSHHNNHQHEHSTSNLTTQYQMTNNLFLKQENLLQLKEEEQESILKESNQILPRQDENEIIQMKQAQDNELGNQFHYESNVLTQQSNKIFFSLNARQKWIQSLDKDPQWKKRELDLICRMKKILHNPYIQFQDY